MLELLTPLIYPSRANIGTLEAARGGLAWALIFATGIVLLGVYLEKETFSKYLQHTGWSLLIVGLAAEIFISAELWGIDNGITHLQEDKIFSLENKIAPRDLDANAQKALGKQLSSFSGKTFSLLRICLISKPLG